MIYFPNYDKRENELKGAKKGTSIENENPFVNLRGFVVLFTKLWARRFRSANNCRDP